MGKTARTGAHRADYERPGARSLCVLPAHPSPLIGRPIARAGLALDHGFTVHKRDLARQALIQSLAQFIHRAEINHFGVHAAPAAARAAQRGRAQLELVGTAQDQAGLAALPERQGKGFDRYPIETELFAQSGAPAAGPGFGLGTGQARADVRGKRTDDVPGQFAAQAALDKALGGGQRFGGDVVSVGLRDCGWDRYAGDAEREQSADEQGKHANHGLPRVIARLQSKLGPRWCPVLAWRGARALSKKALSIR